ncbi:MAG: hypothetical protein LBV08_04065, partial [Clostridiales bacterium]|nr:hypothetical protein [Clostridiales bacterium]
MKKKLAVLLAALLMAPSFSLSAASENTLTKGRITAVPGTVIFEEGSGTNGIVNLFPDRDPSDSEEIINFVSGTSVNIKVKSAEEAGATFKVVLENARWFFRNNRNNADAVKAQLDGIGKLALANMNLSKNGANFANTDVTTGLINGDKLDFGSIR